MEQKTLGKCLIVLISNQINMEKVIPVRYTKSDEEEAIKKVWERKDQIKEEKEESITISSDYKNWIIV